MADVTRLLQAIEHGEGAAAEELLSIGRPGSGSKHALSQDAARRSGRTILCGKSDFFLSNRFP